MSGLLASKWANAESVSEPVKPLVKAPVHASVHTPVKASAKSKASPPKQQTPVSNGLLRSKWANAPDDQQHPINANDSTSTTKPISPVRSDRHSKKHSPKQHAPKVGDVAISLKKVDLDRHHKPFDPRSSKQNAHSSIPTVHSSNVTYSSKQTAHSPKQSTHPPKQMPHLQSTHPPKQHPPKQNIPKQNIPKQNIPKQITPKQITPKQITPRRSSQTSLEDEDERTPMTQAGNVLAARLGMAVAREPSIPQPSRPRTQGTANRPKPRADEAPRKYVPPKKKLSEEGSKPEVSREQLEKDAKLKAEVQSLFEKMTDKSTSWADLEDD